MRALEIIIFIIKRKIWLKGHKPLGLITAFSL